MTRAYTERQALRRDGHVTGLHRRGRAQKIVLAPHAVPERAVRVREVATRDGVCERRIAALGVEALTADVPICCPRPPPIESHGCA